MKKILVLIIFAFCIFPLTSVHAAQAEYADKDEIISSQYRSSGADKLPDALPDSVKDQLSDIEIDSPDGIDTEKIGLKYVFGKILESVCDRYKSPFASGCTMLAVLLLGSAAGSTLKGNKALEYALCAAMISASAIPVSGTIISAAEALKSAGIFMLAFVPAFAAILCASGRTLTAAGYSTVMLAVSEGVSWLCSFVLVPLSGIQLSLGIGGALMPDISTDSIIKTIKKISNWFLGLASTVLLGVLSIQTSISSASENLSAKTAKFIVGTTVPVVGNAVSEALGTVKGCINLLRSSVCVYGIIAVALIILPLITELLLWRVSANVCSSAADVLSQPKAAGMLKAVDSAVSFIIGIIILTFVLFIISLTVVLIF